MEKRLLLSTLFVGLLGTALFVYLIDPFLGWFWSYINNSAAVWMEYFIDSIFLRTAKGPTKGFEVVTLVMVQVFLIISLLAYIAYLTFRHTINRKLSTFVEKNGENYALAARLQNFMVFLGLLNLLSIGFLAKGMIQVLIMDVSVNALNTEFEQRLRIISPYVDAKEIVLLKSQWALMNDRQDFRLIIGSLDELAIKANIEFPEKSFSDYFTE